MRLFSCLILAAFLFSCSSSKNVFKSADFESRAVRHQTIAILPINLIQSNSKLKSAAEEYGYTFQKQLLLHLLEYTSKNNEGHSIAFQPAGTTDSLLEQNNFTVEQAYQRKPGELAKLLGVDAVFMTTLTDKTDFTQGQGFGLSGGRSIYNSDKSNPNAQTLEVNPVNLDMSANLYDAVDGKLIWRTYRTGGTDLPSKMGALIQYFSEWIAKRFPYKS
jgi:hypothetical protein